MFTYDNASRLSTVGDGTNSATYSYLANSPLVEQITFKHNTTTRMTTTKAYDYLNRLTSISHADSQPSTLASFNYQYNSANQRTNVAHADNSFWEYAYDSLGQVERGTKNKAPGTPYPGLQYEYDYDDIGNRTQTRTGGDANGANLRSAAYSPNLLNQYTQRDVPPYVEVQGEAATNATVTVNNQATERLGRYYRKELNPDNSAGPVLQGITNVAVLPGAGGGGTDIVTEQAGSRLIAQDPESFTYDSDGNLTSDSLWTNTWNGENRLIAMESRSSVSAAAKKKLLFEYDHQGRRIRKEVLTWDQASSSYLPTATNLFVYDGWNLIATLNSTSSQLAATFTWGLDLSGSLQAAGGVGGLLFFTQHTGSQSSTHSAGHDGNGNVTLLADTEDSSVSANYEYSPFGQVIRASGPMGYENPIRFSGKYQDSETGYNYYGLRFYNSELGRWLNRDPIEELGGFSLYGMVANDAVNKYDILGLACDEVLVVIWLSRHDQKMDKATALAILATIHRKLKWKIIEKPVPGGAHLGEQKAMRKRGWKRVYYLEGKVINKGDSLTGPLGVGNAWKPVIYSNRFRNDFNDKVSNGTMKSAITSRYTAETASVKLSGWAFAHEVCHSAGKWLHVGSNPMYLMSKKRGWSWLLSPPLISTATKNELISELGVK